MKPAIILIPGAWHTASCYDLLTPLLKDQGYDVHALTLPSVGADPAISGIEPDIEHIRQHILPLLEAGKELVVAMHSYGGIPGASAMKGLGRKDRDAQGAAGGVVALVFIAAYMIDEGKSVKDLGGGRGGKGGPATLKIENNRSQHLDPIPAMYHDVSPALAQKFASGLRPFSVPTISSPATYAAHKFIPTTYLLCTNDRMIAHEKQVAMVENAGVPVTAFTSDSSHSPFASQPEFTARVIRHAAGEKIDVGGL